MIPRRRKILFIAEAVTLAHVGRMLSLAESLDRERYDVTVAFDPRYLGAIGTTSVPIRQIRTIPSAQFFNALAKGAPIYRWQDLVEYVEEDRDLIRFHEPDVVVGDFRLSLAASARLERVPYVTVTNAYWSPLARIEFVVPDLPMTRIFGVAAAQALFNLARPVAFALHAAPVNRMLRHFDLPPLQSDLRDAYTHADFTLYSDIRELVPMRPLPDHHEFIGPVQWAPAIPPPDWWDDVPRTKPVVYVNLGSSGPVDLFAEVLRELADMPVTVIAASAGRLDVKQLGSGAFVADFLPGNHAVEIASVVVCNGGSPACYQALGAGKPVVGVPANLDQFLNMSLVGRSGAGILIRRGRDTASAVKSAVTAILGADAFGRQAASLRSHMLEYCPAVAFEAVVERARRV